MLLTLGWNDLNVLDWMTLKAQGQSLVIVDQLPAGAGGTTRDDVDAQATSVEVPAALSRSTQLQGINKAVGLVVDEVHLGTVHQRVDQQPDQGCS